MGVGGQCHALVTVALGKRPGTHCQGGWVDPRAGLDGCEKSCIHQDSILPDCSACSVLLY